MTEVRQKSLDDLQKKEKLESESTEKSTCVIDFYVSNGQKFFN